MTVLFYLGWVHAIGVAGLALKISWDLFLVEVHLAYHEVRPRMATSPEEARR
jgi:hypothetical protein